MTSKRPGFYLVNRLPERPPQATRTVIVVIALWLLSLGLIWWLATWRAAPAFNQTNVRLQEATAHGEQLQVQLDEIRQQLVTLRRSDEISRAANQELQASLAERDEEIASLRADQAFYERLVGSTSQRKGLNVHTVEFSSEQGGTWSYKAVLTQNLNRGAVSRGKMLFAVEGVRAGKLETITWDELHQRTGAAGQDYSFRYFQELTGSVILPQGFTPQRVRVSLRGEGQSVDQVFDWKLINAANTNSNTDEGK